MLPSLPSDTFCNMDVLEAHQLTHHVFMTKYRNKRPLVVRGIARKWPALAHWTKGWMTSALGDKVVYAGDKDQRDPSIAKVSALPEGHRDKHVKHALKDFLRTCP